MFGRFHDLLPGLIISIMIICSILLLSRYGLAEEPRHPKLALIIVSTYGGVEGVEFDKASSFHDHLVESGISEDDIIFLAGNETLYSDGVSNTSDVESSFYLLIDDDNASKEVVIYISDHVPPCGEGSEFIFSDGNISFFQINMWVDDIICTDLEIIVCGNHSGRSGPELASEGRSVMCSMDSNQSFDHDQFNITRSLEDASSDTDGDCIVSYEEAFYHECDLLEESGQDPVIWI